jgi:muconolactone delta-isomerase
VMEFLVELDVNIPGEISPAEIAETERAEASAAIKLVTDGRLLRLWKPRFANGRTRVLGLYRAETKAQLQELLGALPLSKWMRTNITPLEPHANDPVLGRPRPAENDPLGRIVLPEPQLTFVYRLEASLGDPFDIGETSQGGDRRIVPQIEGTFAGPSVSGSLLPGASADWQTLLSDGSALVDLRYTLKTDEGVLLSIYSRGTRHGAADVLARLGRSEEVDPSEYTFRMLTRIETGVSDFDWMNKGVFISVGGRQSASVIYETYLVG